MNSMGRPRLKADGLVMILATQILCITILNKWLLTSHGVLKVSTLFSATGTHPIGNVDVNVYRVVYYKK